MRPWGPGKLYKNRPAGWPPAPQEGARARGRQSPPPGTCKRGALVRTLREAYMEVFPTASIIERRAVLPAESDRDGPA